MSYGNVVATASVFSGGMMMMMMKMMACEEIKAELSFIRLSLWPKFTEKKE